MVKKRGKKAKAKRPAKRSRRAPSRATKPPSVAEAIPPATPEEERAASREFSSSLVARGEAVPAGQPLPPGATHEIVGQEADGTPIVKRRRFSAH